MYRFAFVLEQTLGHVAHARNIRRALDQHADEIAATLIPVDYRRPAGESFEPFRQTAARR